LTLAIVAASASAAYGITGGKKAEQRVEFSTDGSVAGSQASARRLLDPTQGYAEIGCVIEGSTFIDGSGVLKSNPAEVTCYAHTSDPSQPSKSCTSDADSIVKAVEAVVGDSMITFKAYGSGSFPNDCQWITVDNSSAWAAKTSGLIP
jgi:hypothetical protein